MLDCVLSVHDAYPIIILCKERIQQQCKDIAQNPNFAASYSWKGVFKRPSYQFSRENTDN